MGWNKEKLVFALALLVLVGSVVHSASSFLGSGRSLEPLSEPREAAVGIVGGSISLDWHTPGEGRLRDPFRAKSEWRPARPDGLATPPYQPLDLRIPLPATVADSPTAWPGLEEAQP